MAYFLLVKPVNEQERYSAIDFRLDNESVVELQIGSAYDLTAAEVSRLSQNVELKSSSSGASPARIPSTNLRFSDLADVDLTGASEGQSVGLGSSGKWTPQSAGSGGAVDVRNYGSLGTPALNRATINAAILAISNAGGGRVSLPAELPEILVDQAVILRSWVTLVGHGSRATVIKLADGAAGDVIQSYNFDALDASVIGAAPAAGTGPRGFGLEGITADGNKANCSSGRNAISLWGYDFRVKDVVGRNAIRDGIYSNWGGTSLITDAVDNQMEAQFQEIKGHNNDRYGAWFKGPHDSHARSVHCFLNGEANARVSALGMQVWGLHAYSLDTPIGAWVDGQGACLWDCELEGAAGPNLLIDALQVTYTGIIFDPAPGRAGAQAIAFGANNSGQWIVNARMFGPFAGGALDWTGDDGLGNLDGKLAITAGVGSGAVAVGSQHATTIKNLWAVDKNGQVISSSAEFLFQVSTVGDHYVGAALRLRAVNGSSYIEAFKQSADPAARADAARAYARDDGAGATELAVRFPGGIRVIERDGGLGGEWKEVKGAGAQGILQTAVAAGNTYMATQNSVALIAGVNSAVASFPFDPANYAQRGKATKIKLIVDLITNAVAPAITFTWHLYPVATWGGASAAAPTIATLGATALDVAMITPAAAGPTKAEAIADAPAIGRYVVALTVSGTNAANSQFTWFPRLLVAAI